MATKNAFTRKGFVELAAPFAACFLGIAAAAGLALAFIAPPEPPKGREGKAFRDLADPAASATAAFLAEGMPHPVESEADGEMMRCVVQDLRAAGYGDSDMRIEAFLYANGEMRGQSLGNRRKLRLNNVVVELKGSSPDPKAGRTIVVSHYDSVRAGPGAGDDGFGVLACLGALKALKDRKPFKNDMAFLFTDGEEAGLFGSSAAVKVGGMAQGTSFVVNMEGLEKGIVLPMELSSPNGRALDAYLASFPRPYVMGLAIDIFARMPFGTDLNEFEEAGVPGMTIFPMSDFSNYHADTDTLDRLDPRSLAQASSGLVKLLGRIDATGGRASKVDWVAQSLLPGLTLRYPTDLSWLIVALAWVVFVASAAYALATGKAKLGPSLVSSGVSILALGVGVVLSDIAQIALGSPGNPNRYFNLKPALRADLLARVDFNLAMAIAVPLFLSGLVCVIFRKRLRGASGTIGALVLPLFAASVLARSMPRSAPILLIPAAAAAIVFALSLFLPRNALARSACAFAVSAVFALLASGFLVVFNKTIVIFAMTPIVAVFACFALTLAAPYLADGTAEDADLAAAPATGS